MGFRYRRRIRLAPGLHVNISSHGSSLSIGGRGATLNVGRRGVRETVGLPGTGLSYTRQLGQQQHRADEEVSGSAKSHDFWPLFRFLGLVLLAMMAWEFVKAMMAPQ